MNLSTIKFEKLSNLSPENVKEIQRLLVNCGYQLTIDGIVGPLTTKAFNSFKKAHSLDHPDIFGQTTYQYLLRYDQDLTPAINIIKEFEGFRRNAYLCPANVWTIGYGTTVYPDGRRVQKGDVVSSKEAEELLLWYLKSRVVPKLSAIPYWQQMTNNQRCALMSFAYNVGEHFYGDSGFRSITNALKTRDWDAVPTMLNLYVNPGTSFTEGLKRRRRKEIELWESKKW